MAPSASETRPLKPLSSASLFTDPLSIDNRIRGEAAWNLRGDLSRKQRRDGRIVETDLVRGYHAGDRPCPALYVEGIGMQRKRDTLGLGQIGCDRSQRRRNVEPGCVPCPAAFTESACNSILIGLSVPPSDSGRPEPEERRSSLGRARNRWLPFGLIVPDALPEIFSPESVAWSMAIPPADRETAGCVEIERPKPRLAGLAGFSRAELCIEANVGSLRTVPSLQRFR